MDRSSCCELRMVGRYRGRTLMPVLPRVRMLSEMLTNHPSSAQGRLVSARPALLKR
jgi:hypothetical protein